MPKISRAINRNELINKKLFQINFRANSRDEVMTTLVYHKKLTEGIRDTGSKISI